MISPAERLKADGFREVRLVVPDAPARITRDRIGAQVLQLDPVTEEEALD